MEHNLPISQWLSYTNGKLQIRHSTSGELYESGLKQSDKILNQWWTLADQKMNDNAMMYEVEVEYMEIEIKQQWRIMARGPSLR